MKVSAEGYFLNTMVNLETGRADIIPEWRHPMDSVIVGNFLTFEYID
jgi:hypothetical protein